MAVGRFFGDIIVPPFLGPTRMCSVAAVSTAPPKRSVAIATPQSSRLCVAMSTRNGVSRVSAPELSTYEGGARLNNRCQLRSHADQELAKQRRERLGCLKVRLVSRTGNDPQLRAANSRRECTSGRHVGMVSPTAKHQCRLQHCIELAREVSASANAPSELSPDRKTSTANESKPGGNAARCASHASVVSPIPCRNTTVWAAGMAKGPSVAHDARMCE